MNKFITRSKKSIELFRGIRLSNKKASKVSLENKDFPGGNFYQ